MSDSDPAREERGEDFVTLCRDVAAFCKREFARIRTSVSRKNLVPVAILTGAKVASIGTGDELSDVELAEEDVDPRGHSSGALFGLIWL